MTMNYENIADLDILFSKTLEPDPSSAWRSVNATEKRKISSGSPAVAFCPAVAVGQQRDKRRESVKQLRKYVSIKY